MLLKIKPVRSSSPPHVNSQRILHQTQLSEIFYHHAEKRWSLKANTFIMNNLENYCANLASRVGKQFRHSAWLLSLWTRNTYVRICPIVILSNTGVSGV